MSDPTERIHAALLRFKATRPVMGDRQIKLPKSEELKRNLVVVNEQNLAALSLSSLSRAYPNTPVAKPVNTE